MKVVNRIEELVEQITNEEGKCPRLERWAESWPDRLCGDIYDDPRFEAGLFVITSPVVTQGPAWAQTRNTFYILGKRR